MSKPNKIIGIIPARYASTRFPGKPLVDIAGKSMIMRVYEQAILSECDEVIVATDDLRIFDHVKSFGANVMMTDPSHISGTDRCAEIATKYSSDDIVVNIQGDEPFINPAQLNELIGLLKNNPEFAIATQCRIIIEHAQIFDPNIVKIVKAANNKCLYFSRSPVPYARGTEPENWLNRTDYFQHIGLYGFRQKVLIALSKLPVGVLETAESLEQLRWLEADYDIYATETEYHSMGIDIPEDLEKALKWVSSEK